jgi:hypothetical protein
VPFLLGVEQNEMHGERLKMALHVSEKVDQSAFGAARGQGIDDENDVSRTASCGLSHLAPPNSNVWLSPHDGERRISLIISQRHAPSGLTRLLAVLRFRRHCDRLQGLQTIRPEKMICIRTPTLGWARERIPPFTNIFRHLTPNVRQVHKQASLAFRCRRFGRVTTILLMSQVLFSARHENLPLEFLLSDDLPTSH